MELAPAAGDCLPDLLSDFHEDRRGGAEIGERENAGGKGHRGARFIEVP
jgi:hypothetical protein